MKTGDQREHRRSVLGDKSRNGSFAVREAAPSSHFWGLDEAPGVGGRRPGWADITRQETWGSLSGLVVTFSPRICTRI